MTLVVEFYGLSSFKTKQFSPETCRCLARMGRCLGVASIDRVLWLDTEIEYYNNATIILTPHAMMNSVNIEWLHRSAETKCQTIVIQ